MLTSVVLGLLFLIGGQVTQEMIDAAANRQTTKKVMAALEEPRSAWVPPEVSGYETQVVKVTSPVSHGMVGHGCRGSIQQARAGCSGRRGFLGVRGRVLNRVAARQSMRLNRLSARLRCR